MLVAYHRWLHRYGAGPEAVKNEIFTRSSLILMAISRFAQWANSRHRGNV